MKDCTYDILSTGLTGLSFLELLAYADEMFTNTLTTEEIADIADIVYSKAAKQDAIIKKLGEIKHDYIITSANVSSTYDDELGGDGNTMSAQEFLEDPSCMIDGNPLIRPFVLEAFRRSEIDNLIQLGYSEQKAIEEVDRHLANIDKMKADSVTLHKIIDGYGVTSSKVTNAEYIHSVSDVVSGSSLDSSAILESIKDLMEYFVNQYIYRTQVGPTIINNIGLKAKIEALNKELVGHIDYLSVDESGTLHAYVFKASQLTINYWSKEKWQKYNYYMAFLKLMLAYNGIPVKNIELSIVPVHMRYNEENVLEKVSIGAPQNVAVSRSGNYIFNMYEKHAKYFIPSHVEMPTVSEDTFIEADNIFKQLFPVLNMRNEGIMRSAKRMIESAPDQGDAEPLIIREVNDEKGRYEVIIDGKSYRPKSERNKNSNKEILDLVIQHLNSIDDNTLQTVNSLKLAIQKMDLVGHHGVYIPESDIIDKLKGLSKNRGFIKRMLDHYFDDVEWSTPDINLKRTAIPKWRVRGELLDYNIIMMEKPLDDGNVQIDLISLSAYDCNAEIPFTKDGVHTILGEYKRDVEVDTLRGDYGNAEVIRAITLLNQIIPDMDKVDHVKLGRVKVLSHTGTSRDYSISDITKKYFPQVVLTVNEHSDLKVKNNFKTLSLELFVDPLDLVMEEFANLVGNNPDGWIQMYSPDKFYALADLMDKDERFRKVELLKEILATLEHKMGDSSFDEIYNNAMHGHGIDKKEAKLYLAVSNAYHHYAKEAINYEMELSDIHSWMSTTNHIPNQNIRIVTDNLAATYNNIAREVEEYHSEHMRGFIMDFLKAKGYGLAQNATIGNEVSLFLNLFEKDENNLRTMRFKNPFTDGSLDDAERIFLKKALYLFYLLRNKGKDVLGLGGPDTEEVAKHIAKPTGYKYLWCPLMRASSSTRVMQNLDKLTWGGRMRRAMRVIRNWRQYYDEKVERITARERRYINQGLKADNDDTIMEVKNLFDIGDEVSEKGSRQAYINEQGIDFFETNVENILVEYLSKAVETLKLNDFMVGTRSLLFQLNVMGQESGNSKIMQREIKYILDFLKVNVLNQTIKSETGRVLTGTLAGVRSQVTLMNLGGNLISFFRDVFQGFEENYMRTVTKLNTDLDAKTLSEAYAYVVSHGMTNTMNISLLSKLQTRFRLSNIDLASTESLKVGRGGVTNYRNWAYSTLRRPDFLNRMTLFVARCMKDGCWEGWEIVDDKLVYNWKKDKRFKALVDGTSPAADSYKKAKALYMSKAREWNEEHPDRMIPLNPENEEEVYLPSPYSDKEILSIKEVADNIYGAYDKSLKAMGEHHTIMWFFGMYTTWMNGIWNNYFMKPGKYSANRLITEQEIGENGKPLFLDEDGNITEDDTGMPLYHNVPTIILGIAYTVRDLYDICSDKGIKAAYDYMMATPAVRASMAKLLTDMLMTFLMFVLFTYALDPAYKDYKKDMKSNPVIANLATEIFYKAGSRSYDSFRGPLNLKDWLGDNTASPMYEVNMKVGRDALKVITGRESLPDAFMHNFAVARAGKDTYAAWKKAQL